MTIAIAAVSGGGKTTVTSRLGERLPNAIALYFDEYDLAGPDDILDWVERGANHNEWNIDPILADITKLIHSGEVEYVLLDYPFANLHNNLKTIDLTIFIDTPLDIAMARRILRDFGNMNTEEIMNEMQFYLTRGRLGYESMLTTIKPHSDVVINGTLPVDEIVRIIEQEIAGLEQ
ncbi:uridine kinase [Paenibacillus cellulosilyticus]|uniref:Uridine kinase n=1 Tax=Paenibacillus cellulosilyticus TaxID=375489 RepID=A0A2V2YVN3_9BACL|nr:uridine kinase [Paenibacillus cellulosilyticus]